MSKPAAPSHPAPLTLPDWRRAYLQEGLQPHDLLQPWLDAKGTARLAAASDPAWISLASPQQLTQRLAELAELPREQAPLWGVPFAVKDNIDVAGLPTTAACPAFAHTPSKNASCVQRLLDAGAIVLGKTNLDQFATGLVGTRSPYGAVPNTFNAQHVGGGSSSGSASAVARGLVPFALGTDTAGSGRVPAGFNHIVGLKPTPGSVPMEGVLPACRTLDVVSVFALTVSDAAEVMALMEGSDGSPSFQHHAPRPAWLAGLGRPLRLGVPNVAEVDASLGHDQAWSQAMQQAEELGAELVPLDFTPFFEVARLLYEGPWVAERHAVLQGLLATQPEAVDPTVRAVVGQATRHSATDAFEARYALEALRLRTQPTWQQVDALMVPTAPTCPTLSDVAREPVLRNSALGRYTNFVNLLGLAALAVPARIAPAAQGGLPFGVTFIGPGGCDAALAHWGLAWQAHSDVAALPLGAHLRAPQGHDLVPRRLPASEPTLALAVVGAHLAGMPLHGQLVERGCRLRACTTTSARYRLFALPDTVPPKPGLARVTDGAAQGGHAIEVEVYDMPLSQVGSFLALIPPPLGLGSLELADGQWVKGFICEPAALAGATDISHLGGWRAHIAQLQAMLSPSTPSTRGD